MTTSIKQPHLRRLDYASRKAESAAAMLRNHYSEDGALILPLTGEWVSQIAVTIEESIETMAKEEEMVSLAASLLGSHPCAYGPAEYSKLKAEATADTIRHIYATQETFLALPAGGGDWVELIKVAIFETLIAFFQPDRQSPPGASALYAAA